ncbi:uncharacterized protein LOC121055340 [Oryza brachyantha]|uniref:uncharacterized protein LOC121055340 n=1 Tax=Oryza brachyantha TaxID=4533 RepID=UPI001ADA06AB|nr:uncharacterized protein LOC121055340 [Oryza brachyantha]
MTTRNPGRRWLQCDGTRGYTCSLWIWEDNLNEYVEECVAYCEAGQFDYLHESRTSLRQLVAEQKGHMARLSGLLDGKQLELETCFDAMKQSNAEVAELKKNLECEKAWSRKLYMLICCILLYFISCCSCRDEVGN